jgi:hypothetical protein
LDVKISAVLRVENYINAGHVSKMEADAHADTTVAGKNCIAMNFTERSCGVQPHSDEYDATPDVPIVTAATGFTSKNGMNYMLIFPEALYVPKLDHSLFNPTNYVISTQSCKTIHTTPNRCLSGRQITHLQHA